MTLAFDQSALAHPGLAPAAGDAGAPEPESRNYGSITLTRERAAVLADFLCSEIERSDSDTQNFRQKCIDMMNFVDPQPVTKSFPWTNAANYFIPVPRTVIDAFKASFKMTVIKQREMFTAEVISPQHAGIPEGKEYETERAFAEAAEKLSVDPGGLELKTFFDKWLEEILITGVGPAKLVNETKTREVVVGVNEDGTPKKKLITYHRGPRLYAVPVSTWVWPAGLWTNVQAMPWVGNWVDLTPAALRARVNAPYFYVGDNIEKVLQGGVTQRQSDPTNATREQQIGVHDSASIARVHEIYVDWDLYGDGDIHAVVVAVNVATKLILRIRYTDGFKPYFLEVASPRSATVPGRGIVEPIMQPCKAINMAVNQTFDSQTLANTPSLIYPENSETAEIVSNNGGFFPGIPLSYKEQKNEIGILEFPPPSSTAFQMISFFQTIVERLTRIGPTRLGEVSEGRRTPATLGMATQQLGAELLDELIDRARDTTGRIVSRAMVLVWLDDPNYYESILGPERGVLVSTVIRNSVENSRALDELIRIRLTASSSTRSVELDRQNALATTQMTMGWYQQVLQLVQMYAQVPDPTVRQIMLSILQASEEQMKRLVELANQPDAATLIPQVAELLSQLPMPQPPPLVQGIGGPSGPPGASVTNGQPPQAAGPGAGVPGAGGLEQLAALLGGGGGGSAPQ